MAVKKAAPKKETVVEAVVEEIEEVVEKAEDSEPAIVTAQPAKIKVLRKIDPLELVEVASNYYGTLVYVSRKTGYETSWGEYGDTVMMTVEDLITMKNSQKSFFERNWVVLQGDNAQEVMEYMQIERFYEHHMDKEEIEALFDKGAEEIAQAIAPLAKATKETIVRLAKDKIERKELDSLQKIAAIQKATGFELVER